MGTADAGCETFRVIGETNNNGKKKKKLIQVRRESHPTSKSKSETARKRIDSIGNESKEGES